MRLAMISGLSLLALAGCGALGPSDKQKMVSTCIEQGEAETTCKCVADALEKNLSPELFAKVAKGLGEEGKDLIELSMSMEGKDIMALSAATNDMAACGENIATGE
ncbi:hypothetical protein [Hyphomonas sp.]|uniref:hypothetical protein n=1 Tax=Hyphomonas sp. TaxID=87 RepID=UPI00391D4AE6